MAKKGKSSLDLKKVLVAKGEFIAMGVAGVFLAVMLMWGASKAGEVEDADKIYKDLDGRAKSIQSRITSDPADKSLLGQLEPPPWAKIAYEFKAAPVSDFQTRGPLFDPIAKPNTKRENPNVLPVGAYQVDLVRVAMKGFDVTFDEEGRPQSIAVLTKKSAGTQDKKAVEGLGRTLSDRARKAKEARERLQKQWQQKNGGGMGGMPPGGMGGLPPGGMGGLPPGGMGGLPPGGKGGSGLGPPGGMGMPPGGMGGPGNPLGGMGGNGFDSTSQRTDRVIKYIPLDKLDESVAEGNPPAMTVIPLRMITLHAEVPYKRQVEEIKRALRLSTAAEAKTWGPIYDGYEIQRKVTRIMPGGKVEVLQDWAEYPFEDKYVELINSRKLADQVEDGYLSHFIRYDMALALPLPQLVTELGGYQNIRLEGINETIQKLKDAGKKPVEPSDRFNRINGSKKDIYKLQNGSDTGATGAFGAGAVMGPGTGMGMEGTMKLPPPMPGAGGPGSVGRPGDMGNMAAAPPVEIEHLLLRFIDVDVQPGRTYEYRVRLRMLNPNFEKRTEVANPAYANVKELYSPWAEINQKLTVPAESFLYAIDPANYRKKIEEEYKDDKDKELRERLLWKSSQNVAVVEMAQWMEEVRTDGKNREPVGAWVVADMTVNRGEYVGRKQYVKLPLWSSESNQYVLREVADKVLTTKIGGKDVQQPKGWMVDFTTRSVVVDFEGGKVTTKSAITSKSVTEDVATELLIVRPDGQLFVKKSLADQNDTNRKKMVADWEAWIKDVETRKTSSGMGKDDNEFGRPKNP